MILEVTLSICMILASVIYSYVMLKLRPSRINWKKKYKETKKELAKEKKRRIEVFPHV